MQIYSFMQISTVLPGGLFSLELVQSLKKRSQAVPGVLQVGLAPGCWAGSRRTRPAQVCSHRQASSAPAGEPGRPSGAHAHSAPRPAFREPAGLRAQAPADSSLKGGDKRGPTWRPAATGVSLSSVRNGQWTRPNGAGTWALTCGSG